MATAAFKHIHVCIPCGGQMMYAATMVSLMNLFTWGVQNKIAITFEFLGQESLLERGRSCLAARALAKGATHLLFVDADIEFIPESVKRLLDLKRGDVKCGCYAKKNLMWDRLLKSPHASNEPLAQQLLDYNLNLVPGGKVDIEDGFACGVMHAATGFMMISSEFLQKMTDHYKEELFVKNDIAGDSLTTYVNLFGTYIDPERRVLLSEDYAFSDRVRAIGGEICADLIQPLGHHGLYVSS